MRSPLSLIAVSLGLLLAADVRAQVPPPIAEAAMADWAFPWGDDMPGVVSAAGLIEKPAGKHGPVVARDGHFFAGDKRIKFVGVNICFAACFPPKEKADAIAKRLAGFGVNIVRFHHMDMQVFPNGIFADKGMEKLSPEALDRMDYFIAALKREGVYTNLNLHVSRSWSKVKGWEGTDRLPSYDKQVDIFHPELIEANKRYARDLLTHVNAYTKARYADEPAVAAVEINNEDTLFLWGGEQNLADLPAPYAAMLQKHWNQWLAKKYGTKEKLATTWAQGAEALGAELIKSPQDEPKKWTVEQHGAAKMTVVPNADFGGAGFATMLKIDAVDGTNWHLQYSRPGITLKKGKFYTLTISAAGAKDEKSPSIPMGVSVSMAHAPWGNLGLSRTVTLTESSLETKPFTLGFVATADDDNARITFQLGASTGVVALFDVSLREGGREGLREGEDPAAGTVVRGGLGGGDAPIRNRDWYAFLQHTDETYFVGMRDWLQKELGVKAPITGTIGLGILGTKSQRTMDFVDAHAYWDHPKFPRKAWDFKDWLIDNKPMVDNVAGATLWPLAATRVAGKPFTVTEYNHAAPNDWQAECIPMIFAYAAAQDWDAVYLFDYVADANFDKQKMSNFFSVEGNLSKLAALPLAKRIFDAASPLERSTVVQVKENESLDTASAYFYNQWPFLRDVMKVQQPLDYRLSVAFDPQPAAAAPPKSASASKLSWKADGAGSGQFLLNDPRAAVFAGFTRPGQVVEVGAMKLKLQTPFAAVQLVPAEGDKPIAEADRLLLSAIARISNTGTQWDEKRATVSDRWGKAPAKFEVVRGDVELSVSQNMNVWAIGPDGKRGKQVPATFEAGKLRFVIGSEPTVWYEIAKK